MTFDNRAHSMNYKRWHKCARCKVFTLFDNDPIKTTLQGVGKLCPDCWKKWKDLPQYRVPKKIYAPEKEEWPIEYMLMYGLACSTLMLIIAYYLWN